MGRFFLFLMGLHSARVFVIGFIVSALAGVAIFFFFGYRMAQSIDKGDVRFRAISEDLLKQGIQRLEKQSGAEENLRGNPFQ